MYTNYKRSAADSFYHLHSVNTELLQWVQLFCESKFSSHLTYSSFLRELVRSMTLSTQTPQCLLEMGKIRGGHVGLSQHLTASSLKWVFNRWGPRCYKSSWRLLPMAQTVKNLPAMQETWVLSLGQDDPLEKEMATHSSILAGKIPRTKESGGLQSMGSQRVGYDWVFNTHKMLQVQQTVRYS